MGVLAFMITVQQLAAHVKHALGGELPAALKYDDGGVEGLTLANEAGRALYMMHDWSFRQRPPVNVSFVADQSTYSLPADFDQPHHIVMDASIYNQFSWSTWEQIATMERSTHTSVFQYYGCTVRPEATLGQADATLQLRVWPTPAAALADALSIWYWGNWKELTAAGHKPDIPSWMEGAYITLAREIAEGYLNDNPLDRIGRFQMTPFVKSLMERDGKSQGPQYMQGGIVGVSSVEGYFTGGRYHPNPVLGP